MVIPAIDLLGGKVVRLLEGDPNQATAYSDNAGEKLRSFAQAGAKRVHVVDLDAASGGGDNRALIESLLRSGPEIQVAGGIRDLKAVDRWLKAGAAAVVLGTAAVRDPDLLFNAATHKRGQVYAALDVKGGAVAINGWGETEPVAIGAILLDWDQAPVAGIILTAVDRDGTLSGLDIPLITDVREMTSHHITYSGGIRSLDDVRAAVDAGADHVILGRALYEGRVDLGAALSL